jgi:iron(III) transport system permease protein
MSAGRILLLLLVTGAVAAPLALPAIELVRRPAGWSALGEAGRIVPLAGHSLLLAAGAVALAVPPGTFAAVLLERGRVPGSTVVRGLVTCGLFVPLPIYAAGWQAAVGTTGLPDAGGWRPWREGLVPAVWVHAVAGLPWVIWIVSLALRTADPRLEDDAMLAGGPRAVLRWVLWPRVRLAAVAAACWVGVQALTEIAVTDLMMVRTFAEEVYFQFVGNPAGVSAAVAVTVPAWVLSAAAAVWVARRAAGSLPTETELTRRPLLTGRRSRVIAGLGLWSTTVVLVGWPLAALAVRAGGIEAVVRVARVHGPTLADSLLWSAVAGLLTAALALGACWFARQSRCLGGVVLILVALAWVTPAPLVGLGLKQAIDLLLCAEEAVLAAVGAEPEFPPLRSLLYDQPSPVPAVWAQLIRFFPVAVAVVWPAVRAIPRAFLDVAALDGGRRAVWRGVVWPFVRPAFVRAAVAVGVLALGEVVVSKLVQPPGRQSFAQQLFNAMHYGADATVAAMSLLQVAAVTVACGVFVSSKAGHGLRVILRILTGGLRV